MVLLTKDQGNDQTNWCLKIPPGWAGAVVQGVSGDHIWASLDQETIGIVRLGGTKYPSEQTGQR